MQPLTNLKTILFLCIVFSSFYTLNAQTKNTYITNANKYTIYSTVETFQRTEFNEKRFALVIGEANYQHQKNLPNDLNDATDMTAELNRAGFDVMQIINPTKDEIDNAVADARTYYIKNDYNIALSYFSGHGAELGGTSMLMPSDVIFYGKNDDKQIFKQFMSKTTLVLDIVGVFDQPQTKLVITFIDACRSYDYIIPQKGEYFVDDVLLLNKINMDFEKVEMEGKNIVFLPVVSGRTSNPNSPNDRNSFFTYYLLECLNKNPGTIMDLEHSLRTSMKSTGQTPIFKGGVPEYDFNFFHQQVAPAVVVKKEESKVPDVATPPVVVKKQGNKVLFEEKFNDKNENGWDIVNSTYQTQIKNHEYYCKLDPTICPWRWTFVPFPNVMSDIFYETDNISLEFDCNINIENHSESSLALMFNAKHCGTNVEADFTCFNAIWFDINPNNVKGILDIRSSYEKYSPERSQLVVGKMISISNPQVHIVVKKQGSQYHIFINNYNVLNVENLKDLDLTDLNYGKGLLKFSNFKISSL